jgi:hypothetical protein
VSPSTLPPDLAPLALDNAHPTKTQVQADRKAEKAQKSEAKENEKLAATARKTKLKEEKQEQLILLAKERAKNATARADAATARADAARAAHLNLEEAKRHKSGTVTPGTAALQSKGTVGSHSVVNTTEQQRQYQSPQRRSTTKNKRVSVHSPKICYTETLSVSSGSSIDSVSTDVLTIGDKDTSESENSKSGQDFGPAQAKKHGARAELRGGCKHGTPL